MNSVRTLFIMAAVPFSLLAVLFLLMDKAFGNGKSAMVFVFGGGIYIYGSIYVLRGHLPLALLVFFGLILNLIGAFAWVPLFRFRDVTVLGWAGLGLTLGWVVAIAESYRDERR